MTHPRESRRRGALVLEMLLAVPILVALLVAAVQYMAVIVVESAITQASIVGAREAGKAATVQQIVDSMNVVLAAHNIQLNSAGSGTKIVIENRPGATTTIESYGDSGLTCVPPTTPSTATIVSANEVRVTLCVAFSAPKSNGKPLIGPYNAFGFMFGNRKFQTSSVVGHE